MSLAISETISLYIDNDGNEYSLKRPINKFIEDNDYQQYKNTVWISRYNPIIKSTSSCLRHIINNKIIWKENDDVLIPIECMSQFDKILTLIKFL